MNWAHSYNRCVTLIAWAGAALFLLSLVHFLWRYFFTFGAPALGAGSDAVLVNVALFSAFALHHSILARTGVKALVNRAIGEDNERTLYVWVASLLFIGVNAFWQPVAGVAWRLEGWVAWAAWAGQLVGVLFTAWSAFTLGILELAGLRPPAIRNGLSVRSDGPYGFVRHPIYFAWLLLVWSVPYMNGTRLTFAAISTLYVALAVPFEERSLVRAFGREYTQYQKHVRWRMLPYIY
ncbi:MAG: isoprenylcysteine carboxylmethyltransferase family protein [Acidobacteria bacterium]|nr:MAG: isoprenylcysteine carboxylmethyltransferase family protein [Acidobacteriota bacterium]